MAGLEVGRRSGIGGAAGVRAKRQVLETAQARLVLLGLVALPPGGAFLVSGQRSADPLRELLHLLRFQMRLRFIITANLSLKARLIPTRFVKTLCIRIAPNKIQIWNEKAERNPQDFLPGNVTQN
ncbi:hypothetical protein chiPu_0004488 [Chiloscyllium punctatum]|uniref:Uncharacterized protein n=1 Tax=Chiloscyllium punctatum TaxID=137246 RepID=A0A401S6P8_CHIPU|nr:hypothetical protein [Chiloscyllium punctatum]